MKEQEIVKMLDNIIGINLYYGNLPFTLASYKMDKDLERVYMTTAQSGKAFDRPFNGIETFVKELKPITDNQVSAAENSLERQGTAPQTFKDLRAILLDNIGKLQTGAMKLADAKEIANQAQTIINITKVEIEFHKNLRKAKQEQ